MLIIMRYVTFNMHLMFIVDYARFAEESFAIRI